MKRFLILIIGAGLMFFSQSELALAGSCKCTVKFQGKVLPTDECYPKPVSSEYNCQIGFIEPDGKEYNYCIFYPDNTCGLETNLIASGFTASDMPCTTDADCKQIAGEAKCFNSKCYFDAAALQAKENQAGILGIGQQTKISNPVLEIKIPGLEFKPIDTTVDAEGYIHLTSLSEYLAAVYKFAIAAASIIAAIMIIVGGFRITISAGGEQKASGVKHISQAVIGLMILWSSYALFYTINPELVQFSALKVKYITPEFDEEEEDITTGQTPPTMAGLSIVTGDNLAVNGGVQVESATILPALQAAASSLKSQKILLYVADGYRSVDQQIALIQKNCQNPPGAATCNPRPGRPPTCIMQKMDPKNCPHTTARAVDVWGKKNNTQCVFQKNCTSDPATDPCRKDECQKAVIDAMRAAGFCNWSKEAWHFEKPPMSSGCN